MPESRISLKKFFLPALLVGCLALMFFLNPSRFTLSFENQLVSSDNDVRNLAYLRFVELDQKEKEELIPAFIQMMKSEDGQRRRFALYGLRRIGKFDDPVIKLAVNSLLDPFLPIRKEAIILVTQIGAPCLSEMFQIREKMDKRTKSVLDRAFIQLGDRLVPPLISFLKEKKKPSEEYSLYYLWKIGKEAGEAKETLVSYLKHSQPEFRLLAALALQEIDGDLNKTISILGNSLARDKWREQEFKAAEFISQSKENLWDLSVNLNHYLKNADDGFLDGPYKKSVLCKTLEKIDPRSRVPTGIVRELKHKREEYRYRAAWVIGQLNPPDPNYLSSLVDAMDEKNGGIRRRLVFAIGKIGLSRSTRFNDEIMPRLLDEIRENLKEEKAEGYLSVAMNAYLSAGGAAISKTMEGIQQKKISVEVANRIFEKLLPGLVPSLEGYLAYGDPNVRVLAALGLARYGNRSSKVVSELKSARDHKSLEIRKEILSILASA